MTNLVGNALQHGDPSRPAEVMLTDDPTHIELRVRNWGSPISAANLERLFEPYRRGEEARPSGLGLGLFITRQIVIAHGGTIDCRSTAADGTVFTVRLPRRHNEQGRDPEHRGRFPLRMHAHRARSVGPIASAKLVVSP